jgi:pyrrolidone-carboxylate peptidase
VNVKGALEILNRYGAPAVAAFHAGTFLCNQVFFLGCHGVESGTSLEKAAFIHVPPMDSFEPLVEGLVGLFLALENGEL